MADFSDGKTPGDMFLLFVRVCSHDGFSDVEKSVAEPASKFINVAAEFLTRISHISIASAV